MGMDFWTRVRTQLMENVEFDTPPESPSISLDADDEETVTLHGTWMAEYEPTLLGDEADEVEHPTQRRVEITDGALWKAARDRLQTARARVDVDGDVSDITLYCPAYDIPFVESDGETLRLLVTTTASLDSDDALPTARQHIAESMQDLDSAVTSDDITTLEAFFDDFAENSLSSVNATVLTTSPSNYHPDVERPEDVADAVAETPEERDEILGASSYGERYLGRGYDDTLDEELASLFEARMDAAVDATVTTADEFVVEGETIRAKWAAFPADAYDIMGPQSMWVEDVPVGVVETSFWVHVPL